MKTKDYVMSITLNGFVGYLWLLFSSHVFNFTAEMENSAFISGISIIIGILLFGAIIKRLTPFNQYKSTHPVNLVGIASLLLVVFINVAVFDFF